MSRFRVVSANLWNGGADPAAFADFVASVAPDIVAVQELSPEQAEALASVMPHGRLEPRRDYCGMGIALRQPGVVRRLPMPHRDACVAILDSLDSGEPVEIVNIHIVAPHFSVPWTTARVRRGQLRRLETHMDATPERRRVVVGDFNATPLWPVYRRLAARLTDAAAEVARRHGRRAPRTWGPTPGAPRLLRIDHAFVSRRLAIEAVHTVPVPGADHNALVVDLRIE